jgi:ectoine hydroxylase-related dioxygenase (phytanoyl-CoA dioxygenase family)
MTSAGALRPVTGEEIAAFRRDGAVLLRSVLAPEWLDLVAEGLEECFAQRDHHSSEVVAQGATVRADQLLAARSAGLRRFADESPVGGLVGSVIDAPVRFYMDQMFFRRAGRMAPTPWHQDISYHNIEGQDLVRAWVSPDPVPRSASLEVVRGSHRWGVTYRPMVGRDPDMSDEENALRLAIARKRGVYEKGGDGFSYRRTVMDKSLPPTPDVPRHRGSFDIMGWDFEPGDVILFYGNLLHGAPEGITLERDRRAYAALYAGPRTRYVQRLGESVPDPPGLAGHEPSTGQALDSFGDVFPLVWSPGDWG